MSADGSDGAHRDLILRALADAGRELSTAVVLFHTNLSQRVGLGPAEEKVLELVHRHGDATVGDLAGHAGMPKNSLSDTLDRLEAKGFVERRSHPSDGRKVAVIGTDAGAARIGGLLDALMARLDELNADYTTEELAVVADYQRRAAVIQAEESRALADNRSRRHQGDDES